MYLPAEQIIHLPDAQLERVIAKAEGIAVAEVRDAFNNLSDEQLDVLIIEGERRLVRARLAGNGKKVTKSGPTRFSEN